MRANNYFFVYRSMNNNIYRLNESCTHINMITAMPKNVVIYFCFIFCNYVMCNNGRQALKKYIVYYIVYLWEKATPQKSNISVSKDCKIPAVSWYNIKTDTKDVCMKERNNILCYYNYYTVCVYENYHKMYLHETEQ